MTGNIIMITCSYEDLKSMIREEFLEWWQQTALQPHRNIGW